MKKKDNEKTEMSYYGLYLLNHLRENRFPQASDKDFITERAELAADTYEQSRRNGQPATNAHELAMATLTEGLRLSIWDILHDVVETSFPLKWRMTRRRLLLKKLLPIVEHVFYIYDLTDDGFADSPEYDLLYTELTGAVALYIEEYGV